MGRLPTGRTGQALAILLLLLALGAAWVAVAQPMLAWHADRADALERRAALAQRMARIAASLPALQREAAEAARTGPPPVAVLSGGSDAVAGAALQQRIQDMAGQAGAVLASTEALPAEQQGAYRRIAVRVAVAAPWPVLVRLLASIDAAAPQMLADDLQLHGQRGFIRDAAAPLDASLVIMGFRAGTSGS